MKLLSFFRLCTILGGVLILTAVCAAEARFDADALLARSQPAHGRAYLIAPDKAAMLHMDGTPAGKVLLFDSVIAGQDLTVTLPVPAAGYYRIVGVHVYGAWKQGRYGYFQLTAGGTPLPQKFHGWYSADGPPDNWPKARALLMGINWGVIYLPGPTVSLVFGSLTDGLLGIESLTLTPVDANKLTPADHDRRAQAPPAATSAPTPAPPSCTVRDLGPLSWVVPVAPRRVTVDGDLKEWDFRKPAVTATAATIKQLGWANPVPQGDADLSANIQLGWDDDYLYLAAHVTDDQLAETAGQRGWGSPWGCDSVVLRIRPPVWLTGGARAVGAVAEDLYYGLSYYSPETGPRPLSSGIRYLARKTAQGYDIEAALPFTLFGFRAAAGDRLPCMLIFSDTDPTKATDRRFDQYGLPTRGYGDRQVAQLRLLNAEGWGDDMLLERTACAAGDTVRFLDYLDVVRAPVVLTGVEVVAATGEVLATLPCATLLAPGHRYQLSGTLPSTLPAGGYHVRVVAKTR